MTKLILAAFAAFSMSSGADILAQIKSQNPNATPYQILEQLYVSAPKPAALQDFDRIDGGYNMKCAAAGSGSAEPVEMSAPKIWEIVVRGAPSHGPLFPGTPDQITPIVAFERETPVFVRQGLMETTATDLRTYWPKPAGPYDQNVFPYEVNYRKTGSYIAIKQTSFGLAIDNYAYCWRQ